jgi:hypothetical protein
MLFFSTDMWICAESMVVILIVREQFEWLIDDNSNSNPMETRSLCPFSPNFPHISNVAWHQPLSWSSQYSHRNSCCLYCHCSYTCIPADEVSFYMPVSDLEVDKSSQWESRAWLSYRRRCDLSRSVLAFNSCMGSARAFDNHGRNHWVDCSQQYTWHQLMVFTHLWLF